MFTGITLMGGCGGFGTAAYPCAFLPEACKRVPKTFELYKTEESSMGGTFHGSVLENEISVLSITKYEATLLKTNISLIKGSWQWGDFVLEPYSCLNAGVSAGISKNGIAVEAMVSVWDISGSIDIWGTTITATVHLGSAGGKFALDSNSFAVGGAGLFGFSLSFDW